MPPGAPIPTLNLRKLQLRVIKSSSFPLNKCWECLQAQSRWSHTKRKITTAPHSLPVRQTFLVSSCPSGPRKTQMLYPNAVTWKFSKAPVCSAVGSRQETSRDSAVGYWWSLLIPISLKGKGATGIWKQRSGVERDSLQKTYVHPEMQPMHWTLQREARGSKGAGAPPPPSLWSLPTLPGPDQPRARGRGGLLKCGRPAHRTRQEKLKSGSGKGNRRPNTNLKTNHRIMKFLWSHKKRRTKVY